MPPRGVERPKRKRQYEHIKESELKRGASEEDADRIAAATTNKTEEKKAKQKAKRLSISFFSFPIYRRNPVLIMALLAGKNLYLYS